MPPAREPKAVLGVVTVPGQGLQPSPDHGLALGWAAMGRGTPHPQWEREAGVWGRGDKRRRPRKELGQEVVLDLAGVNVDSAVRPGGLQAARPCPRLSTEPAQGVLPELCLLR